MKRMIMITLAALMLTGCAGSDDGPAPERLVPAAEIYSDLDSAYSAEYTKFTLPERSLLNIAPPEGVYELELEAINKTEDKEWERQKSAEIREVFGVPAGTPAEVIDACAVVSGAYYINEERIPGCLTSLNPDAEYETETVTLSPGTLPQLDDTAKEVIRRAEDYAGKARTVFGDDLETRVCEVYVNRSGSRRGYGVEMQKSYKGVGLLNMHPLHPTPDQLREDDHLHILQTYGDFDGSGDIVFYAAPPSYKAVRAEELERVLSFKAACDILESELAPNSSYEFDNVSLMYEPYMDETKGDLADLSCRAKWFFMIFSEQSGEHKLQYISVDCKDGAVTAVL